MSPSGLTWLVEIADSLSLGVAATVHGFTGGDDVHGFTGGDDYQSADVFSVPLLFSFDPHISTRVRLMMTAGLGYQHIWGNRTYGGFSWHRDGVEALVVFGVAVRVRAMPVPHAPGFFDLAAPIGLGFRYTPQAIPKKN